MISVGAGQPLRPPDAGDPGDARRARRPHPAHRPRRDVVIDVGRDSVRVTPEAESRHVLNESSSEYWGFRRGLFLAARPADGRTVPSKRGQRLLAIVSAQHGRRRTAGRPETSIGASRPITAVGLALVVSSLGQGWPRSRQQPIPGSADVSASTSRRSPPACRRWWRTIAPGRRGRRRRSGDRARPGRARPGAAPNPIAAPAPPAPAARLGPPPGAGEAPGRRAAAAEAHAPRARRRRARPPATAPPRTGEPAVATAALKARRPPPAPRHGKAEAPERPRPLATASHGPAPDRGKPTAPAAPCAGRPPPDDTAPAHPRPHG